MESLTSKLYDLLAEKPVSADHLQQTRQFMLDWMGSYAAGSATGVGDILQNWQNKWGGSGLEQEVFMMAALSHITETDDLHRGSVTHPGCVVFPVTWCLGRFLKKEFGDCLLASLKGYEVICRVGEAVGREHYNIFHNTATAGVFGSAAAAAYLLGLNREQFVWALGNAGTQAAGFWQFNTDAAMSKPLHAGHAAASGLKAALLAAEGFTGTAEILEGEKGFFKGLCPNPDPGAITAASDGWKLTETSIKPYPSCRHTHPAIDAALDIRSQIAADGNSDEEIETVHIETYDTALRVTDNPEPDSTYAAKFSIQYCVHLALTEGYPGLDDFEGDRLKALCSSSLLSRITVSAGEAFTQAYPQQWGAALSVQVAGKQYKAVIQSAKGDPENPLSREELIRKFNGLMAYAGAEEQQADDIAEWILEADEVERIPDENFWAAGVN